MTVHRTAFVGMAFLAGVGLSIWLSHLPTQALGNPAAAGTAGPERAFRYKRVICMSPAVTEIIFALGAGPRVVGVCQHAKFPPEALARPECGGFINPNYERILALQPDLVITQGSAEHVMQFGKANGIAVVSLDLTDLESIFAQTRRAGALLELDAEAELLCAQMRLRLAQVRLKAAGKPPVPAVLVTARDPGTLTNIYAVGPGSFLNDLMEVAGGRNVFADLPAQYAVISKEALLERAPEVVVELHGEGGELETQQREVRRLWQGLAPCPPFRTGRVYVIVSTYAMIPGPRVIDLAEQLVEIFHGEGP